MRRRLVLTGPFGLLVGACGFRPLYSARGGADAAELASIRVGAIANREGQLLRRFLIQRLHANGAAATPVFQLVTTLTEQQFDIALEGDNTATRTNLILTVRFRLVRLADGVPLLDQTLNTTTSFNILLDDFATLSAERDARERSLEQLAEEIRLRLGLFFNGGAGV